MGADAFIVKAEGETADKAFWGAVEEAKLHYGDDGYTGTIAEKYEFVMIPLPNLAVDPQVFATKLIYEDDPRVDDKWGPAGCIPLGDGKWLFFGWASS